MTRMHQSLPANLRYPLPPKEIIDVAFNGRSQEAKKDLAMLGHFLYGAVAGALLASLDPRIKPSAAAGGGIAVWAVSYLGWVPRIRILTPPANHPAPRTTLMVAAHAVWGAATALILSELTDARRTILCAGPSLDARRNI
ncbi:hypothetical protein [Hansschlegelia sp.]|uniref:hypothetical protein n=1 Tax=Hansschlegelia sp. TaxID=2041892 RepID=UPI002C7F7763|nr:hypothetical protein [Hansschlegelia sp.]HVI28256.1 hypothetical protein [Hansschlegelia sp.]